MSDLDAAVQRQLARLAAYAAPNAPNLGQRTVYYSQRDNIRDAMRTCNTSANATYLKWLQQATGKSGISDDTDYLRVVFQYGDTIYHGVQTLALQHFGFSTLWQTDSDLAFVEALLDVGFPVVVNILHRGSESNPSGGHVICLAGQTETEFIAQDPFGTLMSNYKDTNGRLSRIPKTTFMNRWQGGYRILKPLPRKTLTTSA